MELMSSTALFRDVSKNVFLIQQIFTCKQYGAYRPDSQQPNPSDDRSIDKHWPWVLLGGGDFGVKIRLVVTSHSSNTIALVYTLCTLHPLKLHSQT